MLFSPIALFIGAAAAVNTPIQRRGSDITVTQAIAACGGAHLEFSCCDAEAQTHNDIMMASYVIRQLTSRIYQDDLLGLYGTCLPTDTAGDHADMPAKTHCDNFEAMCCQPGNSAVRPVYINSMKLALG